MTVRMYSSLDAGAPALPNLSGQRLIDNLRIVLRACLVDGYGSKPGAGWTVTHDVTDGFSLSNGEGVINFVHVQSNSVALYLMEAVTDGTTALASGPNRRSGPWFDGEVTTTRQHMYCNLYSTTTGKSWALVADDKTVTLIAQGGVTGVDASSGVTAAALHFGQFYPVLGGTGFCCLGCALGAAGSPVLFGGQAVPGTVLRHPFTGLVGQGTSPGYRPASGGMLSRAQQTIQLTAFQPRTLQLVRIGLACVGLGLSGGVDANLATYGGSLRGLLSDPYLGFVRLSQVLPALGVAAPTLDDRIRPVTAGAKQLWALFPHNSDAGGFVSLDPDDWAPLWT